MHPSTPFSFGSIGRSTFVRSSLIRPLRSTFHLLVSRTNMHPRSEADLVPSASPFFLY